MKSALATLSALVVGTLLALSACSSSPPPNADTDKDYPPPQIMQEKKSTPAAGGKSFTPPKAMKCTYDTDCVVQDTCASGTCKLTGNTCRFRSDCPPPRGTCINKVCQFL